MKKQMDHRTFLLKYGRTDREMYEMAYKIVQQDYEVYGHVK